MTNVVDSRSWVVVDCETFGIGADNVIISIGALRLDPMIFVQEWDLMQPLSQSFALIKQHATIFKVQVPLLPSIVEGINIDKEVVKWWLKQDQELLLDNIVLCGDLKKPFMEFAEFIQETPKLSGRPPFIWANSPVFDLNMLRSYYKTLKLEAPFLYWDEQDVRTIRAFFSLFGLKAPEKDKQVYRVHDPVEDCLYEATIVMNAFKLMTNLSEAVSIMTSRKSTV